MKMLSLVLIIIGVSSCCYAVFVPADKFEAVSWKGRWIERAYGKTGLRIFYFAVGVAFALIGYLWFR
jgi:hypothetical protein